MKITESSKGNTKIFRLSGRLDFKAMSEVQKIQEKLSHVQERSVILNLGAVPYIDSAGLGLLGVIREQLKARKISLFLVNPQEVVGRILELGNLGTFFSIHETEEQAMSVKTFAQPM